MRCIITGLVLSTVVLSTTGCSNEVSNPAPHGATARVAANLSSLGPQIPPPLHCVKIELGMTPSPAGRAVWESALANSQVSRGPSPPSAQAQRPQPAFADRPGSHSSVA